MVGEDLRHAQRCVSGPETPFHAYLRSSPTSYRKNCFKNYFNFFKSKYGRGRSETWRKVIFRTIENALLCISQVFTHLILIKKPNTRKFVLLNQHMVVEDLRHAQRCDSGPKTHVYACPKSSPAIFFD